MASLNGKALQAFASISAVSMSTVVFDLAGTRIGPSSLSTSERQNFQDSYILQVWTYLPSRVELTQIYRYWRALQDAPTWTLHQ